MTRSKAFSLLVAIPVLLMGIACSSRNANTYQDSVKVGLEQADIKDLTVSEDVDENTITLGGTVHSDEKKREASDVAQANAGPRLIVNELSVQPLGSESEAKDIASNLDDGIEKDYKAALISKGLDKQHIRFDAKNGVLTLHGSVKSSAQWKEAEQLAQAVPNVQQVANQIDVKR